MKTLYPIFLKNIHSHRLISDDDTIILGFSGGKDSVTLFRLLKELQKSISFHMVVAYFNHKLRTDADTEEQWVRDFCRSNDVEVVVGGKDVLAYKNRNKLNLEHAASLSRYDFFKEVSAKFPNPKVATAHTRSDLTETFFIKLFRGSGLQGLSALFSRKRNTIIRPLLVFTEAEIYAFLKRNRFNYYTDYTNKQEDFLRNRIRKRLIPEVLKIEPNINRHIFRTVSIIQDEYDYFSQSANDILDRSLILKRVLPANTLQDCHVAIQRHIIREYLRLLKGDLLNIDFHHIESIRTQHALTNGMAVPGVELAFNKGFIYPTDLTIPEYHYSLPAVGTYKLEEIQKQLIVKKIQRYKKPVDNNSIIVPAELIRFPLIIRSAKKSDKYMKINTTINQKVFEMIRASGLPKALRNYCPVMENGDNNGDNKGDNKIIWVKESPVAEYFKVTGSENKSDSYYKLQFIC